MELSGRRYPIGIQNFEQLRTRNCVASAWIQDGAGVQIGEYRPNLFLQPPPSVWQKLARVYAGGLFPGEKGTFRRAGYGTSGAGMGGLPGAAR